MRQMVLAALAALMLTACATSRSEIAPSTPGATASTMSAAPAVATGRLVVIRTVTDERTFEAAPRNPSTPSIGTAGGGPDVVARAIGRKRNSYGKALGDILLPENETVESVVRLNLTTAFQQAGFQVVEASAARPDTPVVDVHIKKFWEWVTPGFWAITLRANIETHLTLSGAETPVVVATTAERQVQMGTDRNWLDVLDTALAAYRTEATKAVSQPPF